MDIGNGEQANSAVLWKTPKMEYFIVTTLWTYQLKGTQCAHSFMRRAAVVIKASREVGPA